MYSSSTGASASASSPKPSASAAASPTSSSGPAVTPPTLGYFCVYNPDFGPTDETQHEQLLYYVARKTVSIDVKMRNIGLAQGLVNFARIFSPDAPCDNVHSQKNRLVFLEAEPGYWLHMVCSVSPYNLRVLLRMKLAKLGMSKRTIKGADGKQRVITEYLDHEVHDTVLASLLKQAYGMFRVTHGTMDGIVHAHEGNTRPLQRILEEFFEPWVQGWDFEKSMTLEVALDGIHYLPLSRTSYLGVDRLVKTVKEKMGEGRMVTHFMITFEDLLVSTDIRDEDMKTVWKQVVSLTGYEGASAIAAWERKEEEEAKKRKSTFKFGKSWSNSSIFGFYRSSPSTTTPPSTPPFKPISRVSSPAPSIRSVDGITTNHSINNGGSLSALSLGASVVGSSPRPSGESEGNMATGGKATVNPLWFGEFIASEEVNEHFGILYKHGSGLNLSFFVPAHGDETHRLLDEPDQVSRELEELLAGLLDDHLTTPLENGAANSPNFVAPNRSVLEEVSKQVIKDAATARTLGGSIVNDKEIRFVYFNKMNLAIKAQLGSTTGKSGLTMPSDMALSLLDIKQDFDSMPDANEVTTRSPSNHWIVGKRFDDREVYMIVSRKDSTLVEVEDEVRKLTSLYFNNNSLSSTASTHATSLTATVGATASASTTT
ncbi:Vacuolar fusion protein CCZ1 B [Gryganskiella cystojenkinii]|nr:Vacuolar fusion protein CCZ1 B [Gryganskiella cystojenkinii]